MELISKGWQCPCCKTVYSPNITQCNCQKTWQVPNYPSWPYPPYVPHYWNPWTPYALGAAGGSITSGTARQDKIELSGTAYPVGSSAHTKH